MSRAAALHVLSFPVAPETLPTETLDSLRARCQAAEEKAAALVVAESHARQEVLRVRQACQQMLEASALQVLELTRELKARHRPAPGDPSAQTPVISRSTADADSYEIPFDQIEAVLAASPL